MPLMHGKSDKAFSHNVEAEMHAGKPQKQAVAIAYSEKDHAKHMASGGKVEGCKQCMADGGEMEDHEMPMDEEMDHELMDICAQEFIDALEKKDKKEMLESIKALVMSCRE